jgi:hypothetical protein
LSFLLWILAFYLDLLLHSLFHSYKIVGVLTPIPLWLGLGQPGLGGQSTGRRRAAWPTCSESRARSQDRFGDQARSWSVRIGILIRPPMAIVTG